MAFNLLKDTKIHDSFKDFFNNPKVINQLNLIEKELTNQEAKGYIITPKSTQILRFAQQNLNEIKCIPLGMDPYPAENMATGRAFEPGNLESFNSAYRQVSMKNILRSIFLAHNGISISYPDLKVKMEEGKFISDRAKFFNETEKRGVLYLNTALTYPINPSNLPKINNISLWRPFTELLIEYICKNNPNIIWGLWGNKAKNFSSIITDIYEKENRIPIIKEAKHPRMESFITDAVDFFNNSNVDWYIIP
ncbi:hypothetical protein BFS06_13700 [Clostridium perfringens]|uniref:Putative uracil-DNA glycosylase n=3 Tax=Clostridium perfringens TaxID=1502 RepID=A0A140GRT2_CLOPF|nr:hypothetical protein [Clostridium perfringens]AMN31241.1 putative uracil-DNA glycosylase [Clostridium perfringens]TBX14260.1 hypothetical protein BFS06_13700 [Clostridium perfringens]